MVEYLLRLADSVNQPPLFPKELYDGNAQIVWFDYNERTSKVQSPELILGIQRASGVETHLEVADQADVPLPLAYY